MAVHAQVGVKDESTWGTAVTVDRFFEPKPGTGILEPVVWEASSEGMRASGWAPLKTHTEKRVTSYGSSIELDVLSKGFGWWLKHMLGAVATSGPGGDSQYTHTGTLATLWGDGFTYQRDCRLDPGATSQAHTAEGGKVAKWSLECDAEGFLMFKADLIFETATTATGLATASYPSSPEVLSWAGGAATIGGSAFPFKSFKIECDNKLDDKRLKQRSSALIQQPERTGLPEITFEIEGDFDSLTQWNRVVSAVTADSTAALVVTWTGFTAIGGTTYPSLAVTVDEAFFTGVGVEGEPDLNMQKLSGRALWDGSNEPLSVAYVTADSTP